MSTVHEMATAIFKELDGREPGPETTQAGIEDAMRQFPEATVAEFKRATDIARGMFHARAEKTKQEVAALEAGMELMRRYPAGKTFGEAVALGVAAGDSLAIAADAKLRSFRN
ncbi:hypothetical protein ABIE78_000945 [Sinorhizobium fredii]|uniref:Uncharacterized protein n=1 Tax=Sinorhizobium fredii (strain USDA 257) TaxID=1185652 RepID=I3XBA6_SINF2|nr:hypothetical protein [Sinorhizobium fredii]AFL53162.1 hypothetical protein USDA257_c46240 [Sinorhizobium fredii USDA 257]